MTRVFPPLVALVLAVNLLGCAPAPSRTELAEDAATGFVAAVVRSDSTEILSRVGKTRDSSDIAVLQRSLPDSFGVDPKMYSATFPSDDPAVSDEVEALVIMDRVDPPHSQAIRLTLTWDPAKRPGSGARGEWNVVAAGLAP